MALKERDTFLSIIGRIEQIIEKFERNNMDERSCKIFLANGDFLYYSISKENVAHLLGIDTNVIISTGLINSTNSYAVLKEFCEKKYLFSNLIKNNTMDINRVFSPYINQKLDYFFDNIIINVNDTNFVCKYNANIAINQGVKSPHNCEYIVCKENSNHTLLVLHLKQNGSKTVPMSNRIFNDKIEAEEYFKAMLCNQEITFIPSIISKYHDYDKGINIFLNPSEKRNHLLVLKNYASKYNCNINILNDYDYSLKLSSNSMSKNETKLDITSKIVDCIIKHKIITEDILEVDSIRDLSPDLIQLINALNNNLASSSKSESGQIAYSDLQQQLSNLKVAKETIEQEKKDLQEQLDETNVKLEQVTTRNNDLEQAISSIGKIYEKSKTPSK